ncbi:unnamed protein product [Cylicocyclus nassatus]|uniref:Uncharacterized protein n=1 Tax=Cylicocyclus nassatus TaxID=53992 RepID=A0AA36H797_CYLNA|nr:unnamed protein product [Cylicocyclus nassatus]
MNLTDTPYISEWFQGLPGVYLAFIGACCCIFVGICAATVVLVWRVHYFVPNEYVQADLYFIIFIPFIVSGMCLLGNIIPRAAPITYALGLVVLQILNGLGVASTLIAVFVCHVIVTATKEVLMPFNMYVIFRCVDITQMLYTFQKFVLDLIAKNGGMGGLPMASPPMLARFWHNVAMTFEVALVCVVMLRSIRPGKSDFFMEPTETRGVRQPMPLADL